MKTMISTNMVRLIISQYYLLLTKTHQQNCNNAKHWLLFHIRERASYSYSTVIL